MVPSGTLPIILKSSVQNPETVLRLGDEEVGRCKAPGEVETAATSRL